MSTLRSGVFVSVLSLVLLRSGTTTATANADGTCARLTDAESTFRMSLNALTQADALFYATETHEFDFTPWESALMTVDKLAPWFSQCAASVDVASLAFGLFTSNKFHACELEVSAFELPEGTIHEPVGNYICPFYKDTVVPCVNDLIISDVVMPAIASSCCDDFKGVIQQSFGVDLPSLVSLLSKLIGNVLCSTRTFTGVSGDVTQTCGDTLLTMFLNTTSNEMHYDVLYDAVQIPTDQVCAAVTGDEFKLASGEVARFELDDEGGNVGICFEAIDDIITHVSAYPVWQTLSVPGEDAAVIPVTDLWDANTCLPLLSLLQGVMSPNGSFADAIAIANAITTVFDIGSGGGGDSDGDISPSTEGSNSSWAVNNNDTPMNKTSLGSRLLQAVQTWTITVVSDESDGSEASLNGDDSDDDSSALWGPEPEVPHTVFPFGVNATAVIEDADELDYFLCLHTPHGVTCDYGSDSIRFAYPEVASQAPMNTHRRLRKQVGT